MSKAKKSRSARKEESKKLAAIPARMASELLHNEIYMISIDEKGTPFLVNNLALLLYYEKDAAEKALQGFSRLYGEGVLTVFKVSDNSSFFGSMWRQGVSSFILNGDSAIYNIGKIFRFLRKTAVAPEKREIIDNLQPEKIIKSKLRKYIVFEKTFAVLATKSLQLSLISLALFFFATISEKGTVFHNIVAVLSLLLAILGFFLGLWADEETRKEKVSPPPKIAVGMTISAILFFANMIQF